LDEELDHQSNEEGEATNASNFRDQVGQVVEFELKGSALRVALEA